MKILVFKILIWSGVLCLITLFPAMILFGSNQIFGASYIVYVINSLSTLAVVLLFNPLKTWMLSHLVDLKQKEVDQSFAKDCCKGLSLASEKKHLFMAIQTYILKKLGCQKAILAIKNDEDEDESWEYHQLTESQCDLLDKNTIPQGFENQLTKPIYLKYEGAFLTIKKWMKKNKYEILLPCISFQGINAYLLLSKKANKDTFSELELLGFENIANQLSMAIQQIKPLEKIRISYEKNQDALQKVAQQSAFSSLSMGISHEIRNPMAGIIARTELLEREPNNVEEVKAFASCIKRDMFRILNITDIMLRYGSPATNANSYVSIKDLMEDILFIAQGKCQQYNIKIIKNYHDVPKILGDTNRLYQALNNLVINSIDAMMTTAKKELEIKLLPHTLNTNGRLEPGISISIKDTGSGMNDETLNKIFDPFFTTKYKNSGLGLSIVAKVINDHKGQVKVHSEKEKGTEFNLLLSQN